MKTRVIEGHAEIRRIVDLWHKSKSQIRQSDFVRKKEFLWVLLNIG